MATVTTYFLVSHFNKDKNEKLTENIQSLLIEIGNKFGDENELSTINTEYYNYLLSKSSNVFFNDINLYNTQGNLIASSRFKIFDEGILSSKINAQAYTALKFGSDAQFINSEKIGNLKYISVYVPFVNNKNKLIGYIHLPFFDKENLLNKEIFNLLATILNLYLILFVFIAVAAWWMTNKITKPLIVLKQRFADIDLGKSNAIIDWQANDEIGSVVKEYNSMVVQLNDSAAKLAQNQREMAWREMAKQVAHEIKNPLTPMKLNVQLLQRNIGLDETTFKQKFQNVATSLIEQIDSLANIANDFSTFAQITKNKPENIDLIEVTENVIAFFKSTENTEIIFNHNINSLPFYADKDHIVRILNNLIKNSIQAENNNKTIIIKVNISQIENNIIMSVADNGCGINENMKNNIFKPYFTTKSSGTGLGLAMIHQIVESMDGKIYFEDEQPSGTKFTIDFNIK
jgi:nitrogen fixation/metabolism regulation signal transduction histidine kinase